MRRNAAPPTSHSLAMARGFRPSIRAETGRARGAPVHTNLGGSSMMKRVLMASAALALSAALAQAQEVKIGLVAPFTGIGAELGQQIDRGVEQYLKLKAERVRALQDQDHQARRQEPVGRRLQDRGAGAPDPGQRRRARRLDLFAERDRLRAGRHRRQEDRRHHERRHRAHHHHVAVSSCAPRSACGTPATRWAKPRPSSSRPRPRWSATATSRPARTASRRSSARSRRTAARSSTKSRWAARPRCRTSRRSSSAPRTRSPTCSSSSCRPATMRSPSPRPTARSA